MTALKVVVDLLTTTESTFEFKALSRVKRMVMRMRSQSFQRKMAPFPFTKLPAELRNRIYACCLLVEGYVMPYPEYSACPQPLDHGAAKLRVWPTITYHQEKLRLFIGVLSVSRAVHQEAAPIFYGKNTFRITPLAKDLSYSFTLRDGNGKFVEFKGHDDDATDTLWTRKGCLIRHVIVDYPSDDYDDTIHLMSKIPLESTPHTDRLFRMKNGWFAKMQHLWNFRNLTSLEMNLSELSCPFGCCRIEVLNSLFKNYLATRFIPRDTRVVFKGLKSEAELALLEIARDKMPHCTIVHVPFS